MRDYTSSNFMVWLMNHLEMPLANLCGHGDVKIHKTAEFVVMAEKAGFTVLTMEKQKGFRAHLYISSSITAFRYYCTIVKFTISASAYSSQSA